MFSKFSKKISKSKTSKKISDMSKKTKNPIESLKIPHLIILSAKITALISTKLATAYAARLFTTPIKHKLPKREFEMEQNSIQDTIFIPEIKKNIVVYKYGNSNRKILLVHGWSGRGTQLFKIADELIKEGYSTISFDAPAHGKSEGKTSIMSDFIHSILEIEKQYGPFETAIGHSLGGMSVLNAIKDGLLVEKAVIIGSGDIVQDILNEFVAKLGLKPEISIHLCNYFEKKYQTKMDNYSAYRAASQIKKPTLVIHDNDDPEVLVKSGVHIYEQLQNGTLFLTDKLGHRKILGNQNVIKKILDFIKSN